MDLQKTMDLVSVIVPCYNYGHFLGETLESIRLQSHENWECIIIDDGSSDNTKEISENFCKLDVRIKYIYQQNQGLSAARNTGINASKGVFIQFLDADDLIEFDKFKSQILIFNQNPTFDIIYGDCGFFLTDNPKSMIDSMAWHQQKMLIKLSGKDEFVVSKLLLKNIMPVNCALLKAEVFKKVPSFNTNLKLLEDWEFWFRCSMANIYFHFHDSSNSKALIRTHPNSMSKDYWKMGFSELSLRSYFNSHFTNHESYRLINTFETRRSKKRLLRIILFELLVKKNTFPLQRLKLVFGETSVLKTCLKMIKENIYPDISFKMLLYFIKNRISS